MSGILAIDQATVLGWAWCEPGQEPFWGHVNLGGGRAEDGEVFFRFRKFLLARIGQFSPTYLVWELPWTPRPDKREGAQPLNPQVLERAYGFSAILVTIAVELGLICYKHHTATFTKFMTGKGRYPSRAAKKAATIEACEARGWRNVTNDEADALALLMYVESYLYPKESRMRSLVLRQPEGPLFDDAILSPTI